MCSLCAQTGNHGKLPGKGPKGDPGPPGECTLEMCNATAIPGPQGPKGDPGEPGVFDPEDPKVVELLRKTVLEYFNKPEVREQFRGRPGKCNCVGNPGTQGKWNNPGNPTDDILESLRKISYGVSVTVAVTGRFLAHQPE
ncbi:unnamed protein product [Dibothriocephalus latus]|uniref:Uncharacterized protein n=1 Tax=Dibothriocephalus latus TaxID=60516 RepID=A0A3P6TKY4_DIBLA|nr:unnamed protein product [Dibothriocephalus latus]